MNYDDKLNTPGLKSYTYDIINFISKNHPKYLLPKASVTVDFILIVERAENVIFGIDDEDVLDFENYQEILKNLPKEAISHPLSFNTIEAIQEEIEEMYYKIFLEDLKDDVQSICNTSYEYNNRGNARVNKGMIMEALEDYNRAIFLDPDYNTPVWNRAYLFMGNDMDGLAMKDFLTIYERMMKPDCITNSLISWIDLSDIFRQYNMPHRAITSILRGLQDFNKYQLPNITENDGRFIDITIETKESKEWSTSLELTDFEDIISMVKELDSKHKNDSTLSPLLECIKHEILFARTSIGF